MPGLTFMHTDLRTGEKIVVHSNPEHARRHYHNHRAQKRGDLRGLMDESLRTLTRDARPAMYWTLEEYLEIVVGVYRYKLVGWPRRVRFANLSDIPGGQSILSYLLTRSKSARMRFEVNGLTTDVRTSRTDPKSWRAASDWTLEEYLEIVVGEYR
ncbi:hypothetical protein C8Q76DRAFT_801981 [Earliella scabrosa]|nr:hypothetical protein C8Q76DRAFT_801981 [Earliella scabrosa]